MSSHSSLFIFSGVPVRNSFAGCIREAYYTINSSTSVNLISSERIISSEAVSLDGCLRDVNIISDSVTLTCFIATNDAVFI